MKMDDKYYGNVFKNEDDSKVPADEWIVFRAKDLALVPTLITYLNTCSDIGCDDKHIRNIVELIVRVMKFQKNNPDRCKNPD